MSDFIRPEHEQAIEKLPKRLKDLVDEVECESRSGYQSFYDAMCELYERYTNEYTHAERKIVLEAMGSYWDEE